MTLIDHPVGFVSEKLAQCNAGPARQVAQRRLTQQELVDLHHDLRSDVANSKNTMHLQRLRKVFEDFLDPVSPSRQDGLHSESG